jgi:hypothetical protein
MALFTSWKRKAKKNNILPDITDEDGWGVFHPFSMVFFLPVSGMHRIKIDSWKTPLNFYDFRNFFGNFSFHFWQSSLACSGGIRVDRKN